MLPTTRRNCLALFALSLGGVRSERSSAAQLTPNKRVPRVVAAEWASAETMVVIGLPPVATGSPFRVQAAVTDAYPDVFQVGSIFIPNLEVIQRLKPDLIICADWQTDLVPKFKQIAPTHIFNLRNPPSSVLHNAFDLTRDIGGLVDRSTESAAYIEAAEGRFSGIQRALQRRAAPSVLIGTLEPDGRHFTVYGRNSLFDAVLQRVGVANAWTGATSSWGNARQGIEVLARYPDTTFLYLDAGPWAITARRLLDTSSLWQSMPIVRRGRVVPIPFAWPFGAVPTALKFAESLVAALDARIER